MPLERVVAGDQPGDFSADVQADLGAAPVLDAGRGAGVLLAVQTLDGVQSAERVLGAHQDHPEPSAHVFEVDTEVSQGGSGQEREGGLAGEEEPVVLPKRNKMSKELNFGTDRVLILRILPQLLTLRVFIARPRDATVAQDVHGIEQLEDLGVDFHGEREERGAICLPLEMVIPGTTSTTFGILRTVLASSVRVVNVLVVVTLRDVHFEDRPSGHSDEGRD